MNTQPWGITEPQGRLLYDFLLHEKPRAILELGCGVGTSACYMAAALDRYGGGSILSIDRNPELPEWVCRSFGKLDPNLQRFHKLIINSSSYNDELMKLIERQTSNGRCEPYFDFCFIDGSHTWEVDACAFFLADKLLRPGGWILFDDLNWTIAGSPAALKDGLGKHMEPALLATEQVMRVYELCACQHPGFDSFTVTGDWGWARKKAVGQDAASPVITRIFTQQNGLSSMLRKLARKVTAPGKV